MKGFFSFRDEDDPKPFLDHLDDLRAMLIKMALALAACMTLSLIFRKALFKIIQQPLADLDPQRAGNLQSLGVVDSFTLTLQLAFYAGIVISLPILIYFLAEFVLPALTPKEKRLLLPAALAGCALFLTGVAFGYFVIMPRALQFFFLDAKDLGWVPSWTVREYFGFTTQFLIAFGISFELPILVLLLVRLGIVDTATLRRTRSFAFVIIMIFAGIITPTTDMVTMLCMGGAMYLLYELCLLFASSFEPKRDKDQVIELPPSSGD